MMMQSVDVGDGLGIPEYLALEREPKPWWFRKKLKRSARRSIRKFKMSFAAQEDLACLDKIDLADLLCGTIEKELEQHFNEQPIDTTLQRDLEALYGLHGQRAYKRTVRAMSKPTKAPAIAPRRWWDTTRS